MPRLLLLAVLASLLMTGCVSHRRIFPPSYSQVRVTNPRGTLIADWVAEGIVLRTSTGYRFRAVERLSGPPHPVFSRYPHGRRVEASGPNIIITRCAKPDWLDFQRREYAPAVPVKTVVQTEITRD